MTDFLLNPQKVKDLLTKVSGLTNDAGDLLSKGEARLEEGSMAGEVLFMDGHVRDIAGNPVASRAHAEAA